MFLESARFALPIGPAAKSKLDFWRPHLEANHGRDRSNVSTLCVAGWDVLMVWEVAGQKFVWVGLTPKPTG